MAARIALVAKGRANWYEDERRPIVRGSNPQLFHHIGHAAWPIVHAFAVAALAFTLDRSTSNFRAGTAKERVPFALNGRLWEELLDSFDFVIGGGLK